MHLGHSAHPKPRAISAPAASHLHAAGPGGRLLSGAYLGAVMAHFVIDAGLWRLRDPFPRQFLASHVPYLVPAREIQDSGYR